MLQHVILHYGTVYHLWHYLALGEGGK